jgi:hypothetical protein
MLKNTNEVQMAMNDPLNRQLIEIANDALALKRKIEAIDTRDHDEEEVGQECVTCRRLGPHSKAMVLADLSGLHWILNNLAIHNYTIAVEPKQPTCNT